MCVCVWALLPGGAWVCSLLADPDHCLPALHKSYSLLSSYLESISCISSETNPRCSSGGISLLGLVQISTMAKTAQSCICSLPGDFALGHLQHMQGRQGLTAENCNADMLHHNLHTVSDPLNWIKCAENNDCLMAWGYQRGPRRDPGPSVVECECSQWPSPLGERAFSRVNIYLLQVYVRHSQNEFEYERQ